MSILMISDFPLFRGDINTAMSEIVLVITLLSTPDVHSWPISINGDSCVVKFAHQLPEVSGCIGFLGFLCHP
jgi:hypothetical protein